MEALTAFVLGVVGSLHCAGMCGPLALALPSAGNSRRRLVAGRLAYNGGRVLTYGALGAVFGLMGMSLALAGVQRWISIVAGAAVLAGVFVGPMRHWWSGATSRAIGCVRGKWAGLWQRRTMSSLFCLGMLNGLLPCGLVYVACAGAVATGGLVAGVEHMLAFGLGTVPMMLAIGVAGRLLPAGLRLRMQGAIPVCAVLMGVLLILRGMSLGIPYVSPVLAANGGCCTGGR